MTRKSSKGVLFAIVSAMVTSIATIFTSVAVKLMSPFAAACALNLIAGIFFLLILKFYYRKSILHIIKNNKKDVLIVAVLRSSLSQIFLVLGLALTVGIKAIFFSKVEPYFVLFWGWLLGREKLYKRQLMLLAVHLVGIFLLSTSGNLGVFGETQLGDLLVVAAMAMMALSYIYATRLSKKVGAIAANGVTSSLGGLFLLPFLILPFQSTLTSWFYLLASVLLFYIIGLTLWFAALKTTKGWIVSAVRALGPLAGAPVAFLLFGQTLTAIQLVGAAIILLTSFLITLEHKTR